MLAITPAPRRRLRLHACQDSGSLRKPEEAQENLREREAGPGCQTIGRGASPLLVKDDSEGRGKSGSWPESEESPVCAPCPVTSVQEAVQKVIKEGRKSGVKDSLSTRGKTPTQAKVKWQFWSEGDKKRRKSGVKVVKSSVFPSLSGPEWPLNHLKAGKVEKVE